MAHEDFQRTQSAETSSDRAFGMVFAGFFLIVATFPLLSAEKVRIWALLAAGLFLLLSIVSPKLLAPLNKLWARFGQVLHRVVNPIVLGIMFFLVLTPIGVLMRMLGKDILRLKFKPQQDSYWIKRNPPGPSPDSITDQF